MYFNTTYFNAIHTPWISMMYVMSARYWRSTKPCTSSRMFQSYGLDCRSSNLSNLHNYQNNINIIIICTTIIKDVKPMEYNWKRAKNIKLNQMCFCIWPQVMPSLMHRGMQTHVHVTVSCDAWSNDQMPTVVMASHHMSSLCLEATVLVSYRPRKM